MSQQNVEVVRRCFDLFGTGDYVATLAYFDPAVETVEPGELPDAATYLGYEGLAAAFSNFAGASAAYTVEVEQLTDAWDQVVAVARYRGTGKASGVPVETTAAHLYAFKGGKSSAGGCSTLKPKPSRQREYAGRFGQWGRFSPTRCERGGRPRP